MSSQQVVSHLVVLIWQRFRGAPHEVIERVLVSEGWAIASVREAMTVYRSARQFV